MSEKWKQELMGKICINEDGQKIVSWKDCRNLAQSHGVVPREVEALREGYGGVEDYEAPPESVCTELAGIIEEVLGVEPRMEECRFDDHVRGGAGRGCRIQAQGRGGDLPEPEEIGGRIAKRMESLGWCRVQAYEAVGPMGSAKGFEKADLSAFLRVVVEPAEEVGLLSIKRPLLSELLPEELVYTVILEAAGRP